MIYGSVCSGIEAATVAWGPLGMRPAWFAEIEPFCCALLAHHYPEVRNYGDFTKIGEESGTIDILIGGTPCQSFSVAGGRAGLDDPRGNLTLEYLALAGRRCPRWLVWENVPGVLSLARGQAFGTILGAMAQLGYGFAYRILDAAHFGVPQRRRRVFVVGYFGDWRPAAAVLFERHSLSGGAQARREAGEEVAVSPVPCLTNSGRGVERVGESCGQDPVVVVARAVNAHGNRQDAGNETLITHSLRAEGFDASEDGTGRGTPLVAVTLGCGDRSRRIQTGMVVRRLTPLECERLMGLPDGYTAIPYRGKPAADGLRYRAIGNSFAVPVVRWIGERIVAVERTA